LPDHQENGNHPDHDQTDYFHYGHAYSFTVKADIGVVTV
jgi:hypothetical protein